MQTSRVSSCNENFVSIRLSLELRSLQESVSLQTPSHLTAPTCSGSRREAILLSACTVSAAAGEPCTCREKFGPRPIFKIFSLDQIRVDQEKKEVRKRRASIYRTSPSDAVEHFLVSHVITSIVVIEFVISKNRRLGAISQRRSTVNGHLLVTAAWSSSLSSTSTSRNVKTAASF